jgi:hypothetical protein
MLVVDWEKKEQLAERKLESESCITIPKENV